MQLMHTNCLRYYKNAYKSANVFYKRVLIFEVTSSMRFPVHQNNHKSLLFSSLSLLIVSSEKTVKLNGYTTRFNILFFCNS